MKTQFRSDRTLVTENVTGDQLPPRVCMHVLGSARNDVRVMRSATALLEAGFAVSIVDIEEKRNQPVKEEIHGIHVKHILMPGSFMATRFTKWALIRVGGIIIRGALCLLQTPSDVYHAHDLSGLPACYIAARLRHKRLIYDAHELPLAELNHRLFRRTRPLLDWLLAHCVSRCDGTITVSPPIVEEICNRYHAANVVLVRNIPPYQKVPESDRLRQFLGLSSEIRIALYQGILHAGRGLEGLIRAAAFLERNNVIIMMGNGKLEAELRALVISEGVADRVKILPPVPYKELLSWTASADMGLIVYPPDYSQNVQMCLPNKLFEFIMAGLPVLASQLVAVADIVRTYDVGQVVTSLAPRDIGEAINTMLSDRATQAHMRRNALETSQQVLCWEKEKRQLIHLYREILGMQNVEGYFHPQLQTSDLDQGIVMN
jgi:glycosyltransferase involved in cell wall biosynthesis